MVDPELENSTQFGSKRRWDPYRAFGVGYNVYFRTMKYLAIMLWIFAIPSILIQVLYSITFHTIRGNIDKVETANANLGSLPGASSFCIQQFVDINQPRTFRCNYGAPQI
jgi:hypothetical protein